jgi:hypothetical protein
MEIIVAQVVFAAFLVFCAWVLKSMRHPSHGMAIVARYPHRLTFRLAHYVVLAALAAGGVALAVLVFADGGTPAVRLGLLNALAFDFLCIQGVLGSERRAYTAVTAEGIFRPSSRGLLWREVEEAWWNGAALMVRLTPEAAAALAVPVALRNPLFAPPPVPDKRVGVDGWVYRISAADYMALRDAAPPEVKAKLREWRFGTGHAPLHPHLPPPIRPTP